MAPNFFNSLCRLCLGKANVSTPIFGEVGVKRGLHRKITTCLPVQVNDNDELPKMICVDCLNKVEQIYIFRKSTAVAEKHLHRLLSEAKKQKVDVNIVGSHQAKEVVPGAHDWQSSKQPQQHVVCEPDLLIKEVNYVGNKQAQAEIRPESHIIFVKEEWRDDETYNPPLLAVSCGTKPALSVKSVQPRQTTVALVSRAQPLPGTVILSTKNGELITQLESSGYPENAVISRGNEREQSDKEKSNSSTDSCTEEPTSRPEEKSKKARNTLKACEFCGKVLPNGKLIIHRRKHTGERPFVCAICAETFISKLALRRHSISHSEARPYACDMCPRRFKRSFTAAAHKKIHFGEKNHVCDICGYSCIQRTNLVSHRKRHFNQYTVRCHICDKGFYSNGELQMHMIGHTGTRPHQCHECGLTFRVQKALSEHLKTHTPGYVAPAPESFTCDLCGKCYFSKRTLIRHIKLHTGDSRRPCEICGKLCSVDYMKLHIRGHTGERPAKCGVCEKSFKCKTHLSIHMRTHTGERPYKCNDCGKAFTQRSSLVGHKRSSACRGTDIVQ